MKTVLAFIILFFAYQNTSAQKEVYIDENGNKVNRNKFRNKWHDKDLLLSRWDSIGQDKKRYATLKKDLYLKAIFNFDSITKQVELISGQKVPDGFNIMINFYFKDDLCNGVWDNKWTKYDIVSRKKFLEPIRTDLFSEKIFFIAVFENGMILKNNLNDSAEYFFLDQNSFFRNKLFLKPTLCGSYALIKPNGQTLIRNGEYRVDWMMRHLIPENWNLFFETED